jgi:protein-tyrosine phosphatase
MIPIKYRIPVDDNLEEQEIRNMELWSSEIAFKITTEYKQGRRILVHCMAGMQRSAAIVAMVLIARYRCTSSEAMAYIKRKRPIAFYRQANFLKSIKGFEKSFSDMIIRMNAHQKFPIIPLP